MAHYLNKILTDINEQIKTASTMPIQQRILYGMTRWQGFLIGTGSASVMILIQNGLDMPLVIAIMQSLLLFFILRMIYELKYGK